MLVSNTKFLGTPVLSVQDSGAIGVVNDYVIDPDSLKIIALRLSGPGIPINNNFLSTISIREYSSLGIVIDSTEELVAANDVIKIAEVLGLNFHLIDLRVETKQATKLGQVIGFTIDPEGFLIQQIIVRRPLMKRFSDPELTISRKEIIEVTDHKIVVKDEEKVLRERAEKEDFIPNFVNPFRKTEPGYAPSDTSSDN